MTGRRQLQVAAGLGRYITSWRPFAATHFGQEGEDILLARMLLGQTDGHYVDVGAHHPYRFSNSYWAYRRGWSGVVIDGAPGTQKAFSRHRPRDIAVEECVSGEEGVIELYSYPESALNTTKRSRSNHVDAITGTSARQVTVRARPLALILEEHLPKAWQVIDFMSIDVEGSEWQVLTSNNWLLYKPRVIVLEMLGVTFSTLGQTRECRFLEDLGFVPISMLFHSAVFVSDQKLLDGWMGGVGRTPDAGEG